MTDLSMGRAERCTVSAQLPQLLQSWRVCIVWDRRTASTSTWHKALLCKAASKLIGNSLSPCSFLLRLVNSASWQGWLAHMNCYANTAKLCLLPTLQDFRSGWLSLHSTAAWQCQAHQNPCKCESLSLALPSSSEQVLIAGSGNLAQGAHDWAFKHSRPTF